MLRDTDWQERHVSVALICLHSHTRAGPFQFQINAPEFVPGIPWDLHEHDEFVQDLFEAWNQVASVWEEDERSQG